MASRGIEGLIVETHNWGRTVAFWQSLGFELEFETDHHSGQLRHPGGGPFVFVAERPETDALEVQPLLGVDDAGAFEPPGSGTVERPFTPQHWGVREMLLRDPDGRRLSIQAPQAPLDDGPA
jgi:catechol 2,3-dioxygenase-like lactoylglutathione lyase family enzyme